MAQQEEDAGGIQNVLLNVLNLLLSGHLHFDKASSLCMEDL